MPFHFFVLNFSQTTIRPSKRVWNQDFGKDVVSDKEVQQTITYKEEVKPKKSFTTTRLNELSLIVDTQGAFQGQKQDLSGDISVIKDDI